MWKLTITQKRKSEYSKYPDKDYIEFFSESIHELVEVANKIANLNTEAIETLYKIENVEENLESEDD